MTYSKQFDIFISINMYNEIKMKEQEIAKICKALGDENWVKNYKKQFSGKIILFRMSVLSPPVL